MKLKDLYGITLAVLRKELRAAPEKTYKNKAGDKIYLKEVVQELTKIAEWLCPEMRTQEVSLIVTCKDCRHHLQHKQREGWGIKTYYTCEKHNLETNLEFFCKDGDLKHETTNRDSENVY